MASSSMLPTPNTIRRGVLYTHWKGNVGLIRCMVENCKCMVPAQSRETKIMLLEARHPDGIEC